MSKVMRQEPLKAEERNRIDIARKVITEIDGLARVVRMSSDISDYGALTSMVTRLEAMVEKWETLMVSGEGIEL